MADVVYTGSGVLASAIAIDKVRTKEALRAAGLPVLDCLVFHRQAWTEDSDVVLAKAEQFSAYPLIVKPVSLGSSIGVKRSNDRQSLSEAMELAFELDSRVLVERALVDFFEINCSVMGPPERPSVCEQPAGTEQVLTFEAKYKRGGKAGKGGGSKGSGTGMASLDRIIPAPIPQDLTAKIQQAAVRGFQAIGGAGVARIDFLVDKSGFYVNEINTLPGSLAFYLWEHTGIHFDQLVTLMIQAAEDRHRARRRTQFSFDANLLVRR
jgi:D-alanine-D-alanine ligase